MMDRITHFQSVQVVILVVMQFGDSFDLGSSRHHASLLVDIPKKFPHIIFT